MLDLELAPRPTTRAATPATGEDPGAALDEAAAAGHAEAEGRVARHFDIADRGRAADRWLLDTARQAWRIKLHLHLSLDLFGRAREAADAEAIRVFGDNLKDLMMAAPAGPKTVMGLDPGIRTGVKLAVVDGTGKLLGTDVIYPHEPKKLWDQSIAQLAAICRKHEVNLVAIGNGTASRETDRLVAELIRKHADLRLGKDRRQRGRCVGLFGLGSRGQGISRTRCLAARRRFDCPAPAGSAGRTGQDRPEVDRRRPVSA